MYTTALLDEHQPTAPGPTGWIRGSGTRSDGVETLTVVRIDAGRATALRVTLDDGCHVHGNPLFPDLNDVTWKPDASV